MSQPKSSSVHRYFPLADSFVEVRQFEKDAPLHDAPRGLDRAGYKRFVIQTCMPEFGAELEAQLESLFPDDPKVAEDLLYGLCIEVNPALEINTVSLRPRQDDGPQPQPRSEHRRGPRETDTFDHLRRVARDLDRKLRRRVHGQSEAIEQLCRVVEKSAAGLAAPNRPLGSFLFVGRTGTGKTELSRCLARELASPDQDPSDSLIRIDYTEYALAHEYSKLIGSPPGYIGHEDGGQLTKKLIENPRAVVLFDEVEKAHPRMHNLLLQILEEGCLTDGRGQRVSLEETFVILTSNAGADEIQGATRTLGFHPPEQLGQHTLKSITQGALERSFSPEFLGRLDAVLLFSELDGSAAREIAQDQLTSLAVRARRRGARVAFTPAVARWVVDRGFSQQYGARELRGVIQREIEPSLASLLLHTDLPDDHLIRVRVRQGELELDVED